MNAAKKQHDRTKCPPRKASSDPANTSPRRDNIVTISLFRAEAMKLTEEQRAELRERKRASRERQRGMFKLTSIRLPIAVHEALSKYAAAQGVDMSAVIIASLIEHMNGEPTNAEV